MDDRRFDGLTRAFANGASRRSVIKSLLGLGGASALGPVTYPSEADAARRPTPTPVVPTCPGIQVWSNGQCRCPSGVTCGPECCATAAQCCDNACCPAGTICIAEEVCCPQEQMCGGSCCGAGQGCCEVDGCCDGVCVSSGVCCTTGNVCSAANGSACCAPGLDCCSAGDPICIDRSAGGCCADADCAGLTDACNVGICDPASNLCIAQPVMDGTSCGECATCQSGSCNTCESPFECCDDATCVDPENGGCCANSDCPASTDACVTYSCTDHHCAEVEAVTCPSGQECLDGECVCAGGAGPCGTGTGASCCPAGETCQSVTFAGKTTSICCAAGTPACLASDLQSIVCCDGAATCQQYGVGPISAEICCEGEVCAGNSGLTCCPAGQICSSIQLPGFTFGACCDPGHAGCVDAHGSVFCCEDAGQTCTISPNSAAGGICCSTNVCMNPNESPVCCDGGFSCQSMQYQGELVDFCCAGEPCLDGDNPICCDAGETCQAITLQGLTLHTCCAGVACLGTNGIACCGAGEHCSDFSGGSGILGVCCAEGIDACFGLDGQPGCCTGDGFSCQPLVVPGVIDTEICCNGAPCAFQSGVACCQVGQICDETIGCKTPA